MGLTRLSSEGKDGIKKVTTEVIALNNNIVSEKFLKSEIITPVQNKEIYVGNNKPIILQIGIYE